MPQFKTTPGQASAFDRTLAATPDRVSSGGASQTQNDLVRFQRVGYVQRHNVEMVNRPRVVLVDRTTRSGQFPKFDSLNAILGCSRQLIHVY